MRASAPLLLLNETNQPGQTDPQNTYGPMEMCYVCNSDTAADVACIGNVYVCKPCAAALIGPSLRGLFRRFAPINPLHPKPYDDFVTFHRLEPAGLNPKPRIIPGEEHVRHSLTEASRIAAAGAFYGQACGDAIGSALNTKASNLIVDDEANIKNALKMPGNTMYGAGQVSGGTQQCVGLARVLATFRDPLRDADELRRRTAKMLVEWKKAAFGVDDTTNAALGHAHSSTLDLYAIYRDDPKCDLKMRINALRYSTAQPSVTDTNEAMLRVVPYAIWGYDLAPTLLGGIVADGTLLTHGSFVCALSAAALAIIIAHIIHHAKEAQREQREQREQLVQRALEAATNYLVTLSSSNFHGAENAAVEVKRTIDDAQDYAHQAYNTEFAKIDRTDVFGFGTVGDNDFSTRWHAALHAVAFLLTFASGPNGATLTLDDVFSFCLRFGGDTSATSAITGAALGALFTKDNIRKDWMYKVDNYATRTAFDGAHIKAVLPGLLAALHTM